MKRQFTLNGFTQLRKLIATCLVGFVFLCFQVYNVNAQTYYVSPSGNDGNDGLSTSTAWKTLNKVNSTKFGGGGKTILFEGGQTFNGNIEMDWEDWGSASNPNVLSSYGSGKATIYTTDKSKNGVYIWNAEGWEVKNLIVRGTNTPSGHGIYFGNWSNNNSKLAYVLIENCEVYHFNDGITIGAWPGDASTSGYKDVTIRNNSVHDTYEGGIGVWGYFPQSGSNYSHKNVYIHHNHVWNVAGDPNVKDKHTGNGIVIGQTDGCTIERNLVHDGGWNNSHCGGPVAIWAYESTNVAIQYNEAHHWQNGRSNGNSGGCDGGGYDLDGGITNSVIQYNYSHDNEGPGYLYGNFEGARPWGNNVMRYNISENDARNYSAGIATFNAPGVSFNGLDVYNNTVYMGANNAAPAFLVGAWGANMNDVDVRNNIFYINHSSDIIQVNPNSDITLQNNLYYSTKGTYKYNFEGSTYTSLAAFRKGTNEEILNGANVGFEGVDPKLASPGNGGTIGVVGQANTLNAYDLQAGSIATDAGLDLKTKFGIDPGTLDFRLNNNYFNNSYDLGAMEYQQVDNNDYCSVFSVSSDAATCGNGVITVFANGHKGQWQLYNEDYTITYHSGLASDFKIENLAPGNYVLHLYAYDENWQNQCCKYLTVTVVGQSSASDNNDFENGYGIWNDGGGDCALGNYSNFNNSGSHCIRLRDNSGKASSMFTNVMDFSSIDEVTISFSFIANSMEKDEDFFMEVSTNGGNTYSIIKEWNSGAEFQNGVRYKEYVTIPASNLSSAARIRIRCDASDDKDQVYIDDVSIQACSPNNTRVLAVSEHSQLSTSTDDANTIMVYPNPVSSDLHIQIEGPINYDVQMYNLAGKLVFRGSNVPNVGVDNFPSGIYTLHINSTDSKIDVIKRIVVVK